VTVNEALEQLYPLAERSWVSASLHKVIIWRWQKGDTVLYRHKGKLVNALVTEPIPNGAEMVELSDLDSYPLPIIPTKPLPR
jgi:hypothetical protein